MAEPCPYCKRLLEARGAGAYFCTTCQTAHGVSQLPIKTELARLLKLIAVVVAIFVALAVANAIFPFLKL